MRAKLVNTKHWPERAYFLDNVEVPLQNIWRTPHHRGSEQSREALTVTRVRDCCCSLICSKSEIKRSSLTCNIKEKINSVLMPCRTSALLKLCRPQVGEL
jgi:hypothetical protein